MGAPHWDDGRAVRVWDGDQLLLHDDRQLQGRTVDRQLDRRRSHLLVFIHCGAHSACSVPRTLAAAHLTRPQTGSLLELY